MGHYFRIEALAREGTVLELAALVESNNPDQLPIEKCFGLELLLGARRYTAAPEVPPEPLVRDLVTTLRWPELYGTDDFDAFCAALEVVGVNYVESMQLLSLQQGVASAHRTDFGAIEWSGDGFGQQAIYRIQARQEQWLSHIEVGQVWDSIMPPSEELERDLTAEVIAVDGRDCELAIYRMRPDAAPFPSAASSALQILLDRARICECALDQAIEEKAWSSGELASEVARYVASCEVTPLPDAVVSLQHAASGAPADFTLNPWASARARVARYHIQVTEARWLEHLAVGRRWLAWGGPLFDKG